MEKNNRLPDETLENAINVYKNTVEACKNVEEEDYCPTLDIVTIRLLEELQQYRGIGTPEECREAVERMEPKNVRKIQIPNTSWSKAQTRFECPSCGKYLNYRELSHCGLCGQAIDWEE